MLTNRTMCPRGDHIEKNFKMELLIYTWMARDETAVSAAVGNDSTS